MSLYPHLLTTHMDRYRKKGSIWIEDGDLLIFATDTLFRVHAKDILNASPIFSKHILPPTNPKGFATLRLVDKRDDIIMIIELIFEQKPDHLGPGVSVKTLAVLYDLSKKYKITRIHNRILEILRSQLPSTFAGFAKRLPFSYIQHNPEATKDLFDLVTSRQLFTMIICAHHDLLVDYYENTRHLKYASKGPPLYGLHLSNVLDRALFQLADTHPKSSFLWLSSSTEIPCKNCTDNARCEDERCTLFSLMWTDDYIRPRGLLEWDPSWETYFCRPCVQHAKLVHEIGRETLWNSLPARFGAMSWSALAAREASARSEKPTHA